MLEQSVPEANSTSLITQTLRAVKTHLFCALQMDTLRSNLEEAQADKQKLRFERKMVMKNFAQWISDQK